MAADTLLRKKDMEDAPPPQNINSLDSKPWGELLKLW